MRMQIDGMRMDLVKPRYETFDELYEYCYKVAGTVGLMTTPVMGIDPAYKACAERACGLWDTTALPGCYVGLELIVAGLQQIMSFDCEPLQLG